MSGWSTNHAISIMQKHIVSFQFHPLHFHLSMHWQTSAIISHLATRRGPSDFRSRMMDRYSSRSKSKHSRIKTLWHGSPLGACLVIKFAPNIFCATSAAWGALVRNFTPPLKPLSKCPLPRPPVKTWALMIAASSGLLLLAAVEFWRNEWLERRCSQNKLVGTGDEKPKHVATVAHTYENWACDIFAQPLEEW